MALPRCAMGRSAVYDSGISSYKLWHQSGQLWSVSEPQCIFGQSFAYLNIVQPRVCKTMMRLLGDFKPEKTAQNHKIYAKLKNIQIEIINNNNILKTWYQNFARPAGMHYHHCVSPSVRPIFFPHTPSGTGY